MATKSAKRMGLSTKRRNGIAVREPRKETVTVIGPLTGGALRDVLWETLNDIRTNQMQPNRADAIATQAREILRTIKTQINVSAVAKGKVANALIKFASD